MNKAVLRADAVVWALFGVVLLLAPWDALYDAIGFPQPSPELWTQLAGVLLVAFALALWLAPRDSRTTQIAALASALANVGGAVLLATWLARGLDADTTGTILLCITVAACALFGALEAWIASRSVAVLVPGD